jgi:thiol-disulfide isomerase/thioredoxin
VLVAVALAGCGASADDGIARPSATGGASVTPCPEAGPAAMAAPGPDALPDLTLPCLGPGDPLALRALTGTPTVVTLWATWCGPCKAELPAFARLQEAAAGRVRVLGVATEDLPEKARSYAADLALPFPSLVDGDGDLLRGLGRRALPVTVLVGADGRVAEVHQGGPLTDATLRRLVRDGLGVDVR